MKCSLCEDCGWAYESHPDRPWEGEHACTCGGAGAPCPRCNVPEKDEAPRPKRHRARRLSRRRGPARRRHRTYASRRLSRSCSRGASASSSSAWTLRIPDMSFKDDEGAHPVRGSEGRPAPKSSDGGATTDPWVDATSYQSGRAEVVTPVLGTFCYLCLRAGQRWDWRRECQSIPVDVSAIFIPGRRNLRYWLLGIGPHPPREPCSASRRSLACLHFSGSPTMTGTTCVSPSITGRPAALSRDFTRTARS
jgi:hypothetical protein